MPNTHYLNILVYLNVWGGSGVQVGQVAQVSGRPEDLNPCSKIPPSEIDHFALPMLPNSGNMDWISYPPLFSGKTGEKTATFRLFFRLQPSSKREQMRSRRTKR